MASRKVTTERASSPKSWVSSVSALFWLACSICTMPVQCLFWMALEICKCHTAQTYLHMYLQICSTIFLYGNTLTNVLKRFNRAFWTGSSKQGLKHWQQEVSKQADAQLWISEKKNWIEFFTVFFFKGVLMDINFLVLFENILRLKIKKCKYNIAQIQSKK